MGAYRATLVMAAALLCGGIFVSQSAKVEEVFPQPFGLLQSEKETYTAEFKRLASDGVAALKRGEFERGVELLIQAAKVRFPGAHLDADPPPNFELWDDIALAECKRTDGMANRVKAVSLLRDYKCAVEMTVYDVSCYVGSFETGVPNAHLTPLCFRTMCGDVWGENSAHMGGASSDDPDGIAMSLNELKRVDKLLKQCTPPKSRVR